MTTKLQNAINNLRTEVLIKKLAKNGQHIAREEAINFVINNSDDDAYKQAQSFQKQTNETWMKIGWKKILHLMQK